AANTDKLAGLSPSLGRPHLIVSWPRVRRIPMIDPIRRKILKAGAAATVMAAAPRAFAQQTGQAGAAMSFYEKGPVRIRYQEAGSGFPLLLIAGGGLNSAISGLTTAPLTQSRNSRESTVASRRPCATRLPASPPVRSKSTGRGIHLPMT